MQTLTKTEPKIILPKNIEANIETVTPEIAKELIEGQAKNRKWKRDIVDRYKSEMIQGNWQINGQPIIIDAQGRLMDGQHRLMAITETGLSIKMLIVRGIREDAIKTIDTGKKRSIGDIFQMQGVYNSRLISRTTKLLYIWNLKYEELIKRGSFGKDISNIPPQQIYNYYLDNQIWIDHVCSEFRKNSEVITGTGGAVLSFVFAILEKIDLERCYIFITSFINGNIKPEWGYMVTVRDALITRNPKIRLTEGERISLLFGLWNVIYHGYAEANVIKISLNVPHEVKQ